VVWNGDPALATSSTGATAGRLELMRVRVRDDATSLTRIVFSVATAGTPDTAYAAVFDATTGAQLAVTADIATGGTSLASTGVKSFATSAGYSLAAGHDVYVALLQIGGSPAALHRTVSSAPLANAGLNAAGGYRFMWIGSGLTSMPATIDPTDGTSSNDTFWTALK
jgi:hypothetical protein